MPEQQLMLAVLENAVVAFQRHATSQERGARREFAEALEWLFSDDARWPFAFVNVCDALGLEPRYLRRGLSAWLARHHPEAARADDVPTPPLRRAPARTGSLCCLARGPMGSRRSA